MGVPHEPERPELPEPHFYGTERYERLNTALVEFMGHQPRIEDVIGACIHALQVARPPVPPRMLFQEWLQVWPGRAVDLRVTAQGGTIISLPLECLMPPLYNPDGELFRTVILGHYDVGGEWVAPRAYRLRVESLPLPEGMPCVAPGTD